MRAPSPSSARTSLRASPAGGERAGLVQAEGVDAREDLDGGQLLNKHPTAGQSQGSGGEIDAREQDEPLGHHADHPGDGGDQGARHWPAGTAATLMAVPRICDQNSSRATGTITQEIHCRTRSVPACSSEVTTE